MKLILISTLFILFFIPSLSTQGGQTKEALYKLPKETKTLFWKRYLKWLYKNFKVNPENDKAKLLLKGIQQGDFSGLIVKKNQGGDGKLSIIRVFQSDNELEDNEKKCSVKIKKDKIEEFECNGDLKTWHLTPCPYNQIGPKKVILSKQDLCFKRRDALWVITKSINSEFYFRLDPKFVRENIDEFNIFPSGVIWSNEFQTFDIYYW